MRLLIDINQDISVILFLSKAGLLVVLYEILVSAALIKVMFWALWFPFPLSLQKRIHGEAILRYGSNSFLLSLYSSSSSTCDFGEDVLCTLCFHGQISPGLPRTSAFSPRNWVHLPK